MTDIYQWSKTASDNDTSDSAISWSEGQNPDTVNNSARQMMARVAEFRNDINASRQSTGSANAYVAAADGPPPNFTKAFLISFVANHTNTGAATLQVGSLATKPLRAISATNLAAGEIISGTAILAMYSVIGDEFLILNHGAHVTQNGPAIGAAYQATLNVGDVVLTLDTTARTGRIRLGETTQTVLKADYPELNNWASDMSYPWGSDATTFTLPSAAGYFLRFGSTTASVDTAGPRTAGLTQTDQNKSHTHTITITDPGHTHGYLQVGGTQATPGGGNSTDSTAGTTDSATTGITASASSDGGDEVRVKNVTMHADIIASATQANAAVFGVIGLPYQFNSATGGGNPGAGKFALNNATLASVTEIYLSETGQQGEDLQDWINSFSTNGRVQFLKIGATANFGIFDITAVGGTAGDGYRTLTVTHVDSDGSFSNNDNMSFLLLPVGAPGATGSTGAAAPLWLDFDWSTATSGDPGSGKCRIDNGTYASLTKFAISKTDKPGSDVSALLAALDDSTNADKAIVRIVDVLDNTKWLAFKLTSVLTDNSTYVEFDATHIGSGTALTNNNRCQNLVFPYSDKGTDGLGSGDVTAAANFGTDNRLIKSDGTTKGVQSTGITVDDSNNVSGIVNLAATGYFDFTEIAAPANPSANDVRLYAKDDSGTSKLFYRDSAGTETEIGGGGGGGLSNVVEDTTPQLGGQLDVNGQALGDGTNELITFSEAASAVNNIQVGNAGTGLGPSISAVGDDANIDLNLNSKGTGAVKADGNTLITSGDTASETAAGVVERATDAETQTGTDTTRYISPANLTAKEASTSDYRGKTSDRILTTDIVYDAMAEVALTDAASITWDMDTGFDFKIDTIGGNRALANPTNVEVGKKGRIRVIQDGTGSRTLSYGSQYEFAGGTPPTLSTAANAEDVLYYDVISATRILIIPAADIS